MVLNVKTKNQSCRFCAGKGAKTLVFMSLITEIQRQTESDRFVFNVAAQGPDACGVSQDSHIHAYNAAL